VSCATSPREEGTLQHGHHRSVGLTIIDGRANDKGISLVQFLNYTVADIVIEHTTTQLFHLTLLSLLLGCRENLACFND
jgi:hypothetical protein